MDWSKTFSDNISFLNKRNLWLNTEPLFLSPQDHEALDSIFSENPPRYERNGVSYHSRRDPAREAARQAELPAGKHAILLGVGLGFLLKELSSRKFKTVIVIEPDPLLLRALLAHIPFSTLAVEISVYSPMNVSTENLELILGWLQSKNAKDIVIYQHRSAAEAEPALYNPLLSRLKVLLEKRSINQATLIKFQRLWNRNILMNAGMIVRSATLANVLKNVHCPEIVIAGAGPSLSDSLPELKQYRSHFLLLAADTAVIPLLRGGVIPDIVFSADPQWSNHFFIQHADAAKSLWLFDPVVNYSITHQLAEKGGRGACWDSPFIPDTILRDGISRGEISHGGSVSTNAFDFALRAGAKRIIMVGQDLSFPDGQAHVRGAALESAVFHRNNRFWTMENHNYRQMTALPKIPMAGINGQKVFTNAKLRVFYEWFAAQAMLQNQSVEFINATKRGAVLPGFTEKAFSDIAWSEGECRFSAPVAEKKEDRQGVERYKKLSDEIELLRDTYRQSEQFAIKMDREIQPEKKLRYMRDLNKNDDIIRNHPDASQMIGLNAQSLILGITENDQAPAQNVFYGTMHKAANALSREVKRAVRMLSGK